MQFTPQQLSGGARFSSSVRIGNWQEEISVEESKLELFTKKSKSGSLFLRKQQSKLQKCNEIVPHTFSMDGVIRFGDSIILQHDLSGSLLACDPYEELVSRGGKFVVTSFKGTVEPRARNTFRVLRPATYLKGIEDDENDPILRNGQAFCLGCNESLLVTEGSPILEPTLYLCSTKRNERNATKTTNRQLVYMSLTCDADSIWFTAKPSCGRKNALDRYLSNGLPATINDALQITHRNTNMYLTADPANSLKTEFGIDHECYADRSSDNSGKLGLIVSEFKGLSTVQTLSRPDASKYAWHFVTASDESSGIDNRDLPPAATVDVLITKLHEFICSRGIDAYWNLRFFFTELEKKASSDGKLDRDDVKDAFLQWGCPFDGKYLDNIINLKDFKNLGLIDWRELISLIQGEMSNSRYALLKKIFTCLDVTGQGVVAVNSLDKYFNGSEHPLVSVGGATEQEALDHIKKCFVSRSNARRTITMINLSSFIEYYSDLSAVIEDDDYFENIVKSNWSI